MTAHISGLMRTHTCGEIRTNHIGERVTLCGWVNKYRNLGGLHFLDLRDKFGITQISFDNNQTHLISLLKEISLESVVKIHGKVQARPGDAVNTSRETGEVEVLAEELTLLSRADEVPFLPQGATTATDELKLKYRYLDMRSTKLQKMISMRSEVMTKVRQCFYQEGFVEVETPILYKSTPEGARDYIVPSRIHPGRVYALPQSPQTLKQLLMIGGTDKYFQLCKCFRDEDLRADRQPEFSQIDFEVSFATTDYIKSFIDLFIQKIFDMPKNFTTATLTYQEAMNLYGSDKPDTRYDLFHRVVTLFFKDSSFPAYSDIEKASGLIKAFYIPQSKGTFARKDLDLLPEMAKPFVAKGVTWFKMQSGQASGGIAKFITPEILKEFQTLDGGEEDGLWILVGGEKHDSVHSALDSLRRQVAKKLELIQEGYHFLWVKDFPLLEYDQERGRFVACHHPFTMPHQEDLELFMSGDKEKLKKCRAFAYDLVCNGYELGGGSLRIYDQKIQTQMFNVLGMKSEEIERQFGFFIEALKYGTPPHGGMALGLDRLIMMLTKTDNIRDVMAFPKTNMATDMMSQSPSAPSLEQTQELHFQWLKSSKD